MHPEAIHISAFTHGASPLTYIVPSERVHKNPPRGEQLAHVPVPIDRHVEVNRLWSRPAFHFQIDRRSAMPAVRFEFHTVGIAVWTVPIERGLVRDPDDHPGVAAARAGRAAAATWRGEGLLQEVVLRLWKEETIFLKRRGRESPEHRLKAKSSFAKGKNRSERLGMNLLELSQNRGRFIRSLGTVCLTSRPHRHWHSEVSLCGIVLGHPGVALREHSWALGRSNLKVMAHKGQKGSRLTNGPFEGLTDLSATIPPGNTSTRSKQRITGKDGTLSSFSSNREKKRETRQNREAFFVR